MNEVNINHVITLGLIVMIPLALFIAMWKVFVKAGKPGWAIIVPIYSAVVFLDIIGHRWTRLLWYCIPIYGFYLSIVDINSLSKSFGKVSVPTCLRRITENNTNSYCYYYD